jgi:hypothetical protein
LRRTGARPATRTPTPWRANRGGKARLPGRRVRRRAGHRHRDPVTHAAGDQVDEAAAQAGVDPTDLRGALVSTGIDDPYEYLYATGELARPAAPSVSSPRVDCIIRNESRGDPTAVNARSSASGLGQFLPSTWASTPQGRAGYSVFNAAANRAAIGWMLSVGRAVEFVAVSAGIC